MPKNSNTYYIVCECGESISYSYRPKHIQTKRHIEISTLIAENKELRRLLLEVREDIKAIINKNEIPLQSNVFTMNANAFTA
jgi:hypothetical protein